MPAASDWRTGRRLSAPRFGHPHGATLAHPNLFTVVDVALTIVDIVADNCCFRCSHLLTSWFTIVDIVVYICVQLLTLFVARSVGREDVNHCFHEFFFRPPARPILIARSGAPSALHGRAFLLAFYAWSGGARRECDNRHERIMQFYPTQVNEVW